MKLLYSHLSPRPVDPTLRMSLLLLHSFHSHCPSTALILFSAQTDRIACLWPPALTSILHTAAICTPIVTHTHAHAIYHPPSHRVLCPNAIAWFSRTAAVYTYLLLLGRVALVPACRLGSVEQDAACRRLLTLIPFLSHRLSFPTSRLRWSVPISVVLSSFHCFDNRYFCPRVWWLVVCASAPPQVCRYFRAGTSPRHLAVSTGGVGWVTEQIQMNGRGDFV